MNQYMHLESILEEISLELILADISEPESFSEILPLLKSVFETAKSLDDTEFAEDAMRAGKLVKSIVNQTVADPENQIDSLNQIISEMKSFLHLVEKEGQGSNTETIVPTPPLNDEDSNVAYKEISLKTDVTAGGRSTDVADASKPRKNADSNENEDRERHIAPIEPKQTLYHPGTLPDYLNMDDFAEFLSLQDSTLTQIEQLLLDVEKGIDTDAAQEALKRLFHTTKGEAGFLGLKEVEQVCHKTEDLILSDDFKSHVDQLLSVKDWLETSYKLYSGQTLFAPPIASAEMLAMLNKDPVASTTLSGRPSQSIGEAESPPLSSTPTPLDFSAGADESAASDIAATALPVMPTSSAPLLPQTIKVDALRLDRLVEMIGEISIAESMVTQSAELTQHASSDLLRAMNTLHKTTRELQSLGLSLRMVPLKATFQRMERVVRDLAKKTGKQINFVMSGEGTELDKDLVDRLSDPLIHLVRNSVDHGIESNTKQRLENEKPELATIELRAFHKGGFLYIEVSDDGRGIDLQRLMEKAASAGLLLEEDGALPPPENLMNLIFHPGLSTAKEVTDISGRGVGMDVDKKSIDACKGKVSIASEHGKGTTCTIKLPLTLSIIDGLVVQVANEQYIIPTLSVVTSLKVGPSDVSNVFGHAEMLEALGALMPLYRLSRLFNLKGKSACRPWDGIVVVVEDNGLKTAILADKLLGKQNTVIKSLGPGMEQIQGVSGATIMPDGKVSLILDIGGIVELSHQEVREAGGSKKSGTEGRTPCPVQINPHQ